MPRPDKGESEAAFVARYMSDAEARTSYPEEKQRAAVAYSLYKERANAEVLNFAPKVFPGRHLEPGLVKYDDIENPNTGVTGATFLLPKSAIDNMRGTFVGKPVVNRVHKEITKNFIKNGKADGVVIGSRFNSDDGWEWSDFIIWDEATEKNCRDGYQLSCAYVPTAVNWTPGLHHNVPYDGIIENGEYTHLAVVPNPRYEGAYIVCNSKGGIMNVLKMLFKKGGVENSVELDKATKITLDGKDVTIEELVNAHKAQEALNSKVTTAKDAADALTNDASEVEIDGKKTTVGALKASFKAEIERKNADDDEAKKKKEKDEADEKERKNAEEKEEKEKKDKAATEAKNAADKKASDDKAAADKKAADLKAFEDLKNAINRRDPAPMSNGAHLSPAERQKIGATRYGSKEPAESK